MDRQHSDTIDILLVEDDEVDIQNIQRLCKTINLPIRLSVARNGIEALRKLYANGDNKKLTQIPQLIIMDINMPLMNGIEFLRQIRLDPGLDNTKVFILTTSDDIKDKFTTSKYKVDGYILKPIKNDEILKICNQLRDASSQSHSTSATDLKIKRPELNMVKKKHFFIIDDDEVVLEEYSRTLKQAGHEVTCFTTSNQVLEGIIQFQPDCVLCDLLLPGIDGLALFQQIRQMSNIKQPVYIIITGKQFEYDHRRSLEMGVDGYLIKPIKLATLLDTILEIMHERMVVEFWGCRGAFPVPGANTTRYGGNTNCLTLKISNKHFFIFDAGTGIKALSNYLVKENKFPLKAKIFITHPHYDHIHGLPFFVPLYMHGNEFEILGSDHHGYSIDQVISGQMDSIYFPITMKEFSAQITFRSISEETITIDDVIVKTMLLNHPGYCLGYRVEHAGKSFCYVTDNELYLEDYPHYNQFEVDRLIQFIQNADVLVIDATYQDDEYRKKVNWGHSCISRVVDVADKAKVKLLCLHHHDPDQMDKDIDLKLEQAIALLKSRHSTTRCIVPHEGDKIIIGDHD